MLEERTRSEPCENSARFVCREEHGRGRCDKCNALAHSGESQKHARDHLCELCLANPAAEHCLTDALLLCSACSAETHARSNTSHSYHPVNSFSGPRSPETPGGKQPRVAASASAADIAEWKAMLAENDLPDPAASVPTEPLPDEPSFVDMPFNDAPLPEPSDMIQPRSQNSLNAEWIDGFLQSLEPDNERSVPTSIDAEADPGPSSLPSRYDSHNLDDRQSGADPFGGTARDPAEGSGKQQPKFEAQSDMQHPTGRGAGPKASREQATEATPQKNKRKREALSDMTEEPKEEAVATEHPSRALQQVQRQPDTSESFKQKEKIVQALAQGEVVTTPFSGYVQTDGDNFTQHVRTLLIPSSTPCSDGEDDLTIVLLRSSWDGRRGCCGSSRRGRTCALRKRYGTRRARRTRRAGQGTRAGSSSGRKRHMWSSKRMRVKTSRYAVGIGSSAA